MKMMVASACRCARRTLDRRNGEYTSDISTVSRRIPARNDGTRGRQPPGRARHNRYPARRPRAVRILSAPRAGRRKYPYERVRRPDRRGSPGPRGAGDLRAWLTQPGCRALFDAPGLYPGYQRGWRHGDVGVGGSADGVSRQIEAFRCISFPPFTTAANRRIVAGTRLAGYSRAI